MIMTTLTEEQFQERYKAFLETKTAWQGLLSACTVFTDEGLKDNIFRTIGVTKNTETAAIARKLIADWQEFFDIAEQRRTEKHITIKKEDYSPVPFVATTNYPLDIRRRPAYVTRDYPLEHFLRRYDDTIGMLQQNPIGKHFVETLIEERKQFIKHPAGTMFRTRRAGFRDVKVNTGLDENQFDYRVSAHGALFLYTGTKETAPLKITDVSEIGMNSVYDRATELKCSVVARCQIFEIEDVENHKKTAYIYNRINSYAAFSARKAEKRLKEINTIYKDEKVKNRKIETFMKSRNKQLAILKRDHDLIERMKSVGVYECDTISYLRARFLKESELEGYARDVLECRKQLIADGVPLYEEMIAHK